MTATSEKNEKSKERLGARLRQRKGATLRKRLSELAWGAFGNGVNTVVSLVVALMAVKLGWVTWLAERAMEDLPALVATVAIHAHDLFNLLRQALSF